MGPGFYDAWGIDPRSGRHPSRVIPPPPPASVIDTVPPAAPAAPGVSPPPAIGPGPASPSIGGAPAPQDPFEAFYQSLFGNQQDPNAQAAGEFASERTGLDVAEGERQFMASGERNAISLFTQQLAQIVAGREPGAASGAAGEYAAALGLDNMRGFQYQDWLDRRKAAGEKTALGQRQSARAAEIERERLAQKIEARKLWLEERNIEFDQDYKLADLEERKRQFDTGLASSERIAGISTAVDVAKLREAQRKAKAQEKLAAERNSISRLNANIRKAQNRISNIQKDRSLTTAERAQRLSEARLGLDEAKLALDRRKEARLAAGKDPQTRKEMNEARAASNTTVLSIGKKYAGTGGSNPILKPGAAGPSRGGYQAAYDEAYAEIEFRMRDAGWREKDIRAFIRSRLAAAGLRPPGGTTRRQPRTGPPRGR
jgi:hypothetical protein